MNVDAVDRFLLERSGLERFGIGAALVTVGTSFAQANLGPMTRIAALGGLLGIVFLAMSVEPPLTSALGAEDWRDLSTGKQTMLLFVLVVVGFGLWLVVTAAPGLVAGAV